MLLTEKTFFVAPNQWRRKFINRIEVTEECHSLQDFHLFFPYCILQRNKALSSLPYCVSQHNKGNFQRDTPITSSNCPQRGHTMLNRGWCPKGELVNGVIALSSDTSGVAQLPLPLIRKILPPRFQCDASCVGVWCRRLSTGSPSLRLGYHPRLSMVRLLRRRWVALSCFAAEMVT